MSENPEERPDELKKLASIASDMELSVKMSGQAIDQLGEMATHESLLILLSLAANDRLSIDDRDRALKQARNIVKKGR